VIISPCEASKHSISNKIQKGKPMSRLCIFLMAATAVATAPVFLYGGDGQNEKVDQSFEDVYPIDKVFPGRESFPEGNAELQRLYERFTTKQSWHFEEWFIRDYFNDMRAGVFVDVGASHYKNVSNTYTLETRFGWSGIAVDAQEKFREGYEKNRPRTKFFSYYVSDRSTGEKEFYIPQNDAMASGVSIDPRAGKIQETLSVTEITLNNLLDREGVKRIDLLAMDIEFAEPAALRGFDIKRFKPKLVCIEVFQETREFIEDYFAKHGYVKLELWSRIDLYNDYFVPQEETVAGRPR
jgi:FkbM family methyltransferase